MSDFSDASDGGGYSFDDQRDSDVSRGSDDEEGNSFEGLHEEESPDMDSNEASDEDFDTDESGESDTGGTNLFDMEASESNEEADGDSDADDTRTISGSDSGSERHAKPYRSSFYPSLATFHPFTQLPAELREMIWREFCPDLTAKSRVFELQLVKVEHSNHGHEVWESAVTDSQTQAVRALACTCRETRSLVLAALPDTLRLRGSWKYRPFRINLDKDVVFLTVPNATTECVIPGFSSRIKHLALDSWYVQGHGPVDDFGYVSEDAHNLLECFPKLETVYCCYPDGHHETGHGRNMRWLKENEINVHRVQTHEEQVGLGEELTYIYCWPAEPTLKTVKSVICPAGGENEPVKDPELDEQEDDDNDDDEEQQPDDEHDEEDEDAEEADWKARLQAVVSRHEDRGHWYLPMINFQFEGVRNFAAVMRWKESGEDATGPDLHYGYSIYSESEDDDGSDLEGFIADEDDEEQDDSGADIVDLTGDDGDSIVDLTGNADSDNGDANSVASDEYDLSLSSPHRVRPRVEELFDSEHDSGDDDEEEQSSDGGSDDGGGSVGHEFANHLGDTELPVADFSSPESNPEEDSDSENISAKGHNSVRVASRPKRHIVLSDEDEDDEDEEAGGSDKIVNAAEKPQQRLKRRIESSDTEDDDDADDIANTGRSRPAKRARIVDSESEVEDD